MAQLDVRSRTELARAVRTHLTISPASKEVQAHVTELGIPVSDHSLAQRSTSIPRSSSATAPLLRRVAARCLSYLAGLHELGQAG